MMGVIMRRRISFSDRFVRILPVFFLLFLAACSSLPSREAPMHLAGPSSDYRIEAGNRVRVIVFDDSNLSGDFKVDPAGNLFLPLVGNIHAGGTTASSLATRIEAALLKARYMRDPKVSVEVQTFRPFYVLGEVRKPGEFPYTVGSTVLSAIARAGGYDYRALQGQVELVRTENGKQIDYRANEQTPILPGDIIRVEERYF
jgi:polysaccharide export outer membrane protein